MISIITPFYNSERYLKNTIDSVINQSITEWELLLINDGSTDKSREIALSFHDPRIRYFEQENKGVSAARNLGLINMKGEYFCFLDSDDVLPKNSIEARMNVFDNDPSVDFVDGGVQYVDFNLNKLKKRYRPDFKGPVFQELLKLNEKCLFGPSWMIKRDESQDYHFQTDMTHAEDLFFYLSIAKGKLYSYTNEVILYYRQSDTSAMKDLSGLSDGYLKLIRKIKLYFPEENIQYLRKRIVRIMFLSWLIDGRNPLKAMQSVFKILKT